MMMRGKAELPEASLILTIAKPELTVGGTLRTRTMLAPSGYEKIKVVLGEEEDQSACRQLNRNFRMGPEMKSKGSQIQERTQNETMDREEATGSR